MAHMLNHPFFCSDLVVSTRLSSTGGEEEELNDESVYSLLQRCHGDHGGAVPDGKNPSADGLWHGDLLLLGGLEHEFCDFPYIGNNHPNWLSYFSEGLKPPTRLRFSVYRPFSSGCWGCDLVGYEGERGFEEWSLNRIERGKGVERCRILVDQPVHGWWLVPGQCLISKSRKL